ncbi:MAG: hypothetical protein EOP05_05940 [Proteobacteria bacterium]|nr:MAG: hypothetical protein EOP05_05940 [Pseudomonadota bacterium]
MSNLPATLDRDLKPLKVGDHVSFIMRGFFHAREQESFGIIESIDEWGGISIKMTSTYKHFLSSKKIGDHAKHVYFTHHRYDADRQARVYLTKEGDHELFISLFECFEDKVA